METILLTQHIYMYGPLRLIRESTKLLQSVFESVEEVY